MFGRRVAVGVGHGGPTPQQTESMHACQRPQFAANRFENLGGPPFRDEQAEDLRRTRNSDWWLHVRPGTGPPLDESLHLQISQGSGNGGTRNTESFHELGFAGQSDQNSPTVLSNEARANLKAVYDRRCASCHDEPNRPDTPSFLDYYSIHVHTGPRPGQWGIAESAMRVRHLNLSHPERSAALQAPLEKDAGGWGLCGGKDAKPIFRDTTDADYRQILEALKSGVVRRDEPGVAELLKADVRE